MTDLDLVVIFLCFYCMLQELLPSMQDVYGVGLKEPKEQSMEGYERYHLPREVQSRSFD